MLQKGANNLQVRFFNKKRIMNLLYQRQMTRQDIARELSLSLPTVSQILKELEMQGLVEETGVLESSGGRKPALISIIYNAKFSAGIEITRNHIRFVVIDLSGSVIFHKRISCRFENSDEYFEGLSRLSREMLDESGIDQSRLLGIGIAIPGIVQKRLEMVEFVPTLNVKNLPEQSINKHFDERILIDNDANLAGFAEIWNMQRLSDAVFLSINKGVGGAVIMGGRIYGGNNRRAGEFGHMTIVKDGKECACGKLGCFEAYCSTNVLAGSSGDLTDFFLSLQNGDERCAQIWDEYLGHLAAGINSIRMMFDTDIIIGGDIDEYIEGYLAPLKERLRDINTFSDSTGYLHISKYGAMASVVGAALMHVDEFLNK